ncbi:MAG: FAD-binding oxidoreductase [Deltaproteobacteria bacterium]|nr:FAD-binding oxidoreductase [Deltaproteobacteria bacterium]
MSGKRQRISGWGGVPEAETELHRPERIAELVGLARAGEARIPRGLGRAYGDAAFLGGGRTVLLERLDRLLAIEEEGDEVFVRAEAGTRLDRLIDAVLPRGLFPAVVPGTAEVTLGGMVAADVHGKNHHRDGAVSNHVPELGLIGPDGARHTISARAQDELFWSTFGGMGLTGFIEWVRLRLVRVPSAYFSVDLERSPDLSTSLARFTDDDDAYGFSVSWIDCLARGSSLGRGVLMRGNWLPAEDLPAKLRDEPYRVARKPLEPRVPLMPPVSLVNPLTMRAFNEAFYRKHPRKRAGVVQGYSDFFFPLDWVRDWNRIYGPGGFQQYQFVVPFETAEAALVQVLERISAAGVASFLAVLKQMGPGQPRARLSFPQPGVILALDLPHRGVETDALLEELDRRVLEHGGRLYLAKDARMSAATFRAMYPELPAWQEVKAKIDPEGRFVSDLARRLELMP